MISELIGHAGPSQAKGRGPDSALIVYDSLKPGLFRQNRERVPAAVPETYGNKVGCCESYSVQVENDEADRPGL